MSFNVKILLEKIKAKILQDIPEHIVLLFTTKNLNSNNDVDLFIIMGNPPINDLFNVKAYIRLIESIKNVEKDIENEINIPIVDFSTIRIEEYYCELTHLIEGFKPIRLHLLIYPSIDKFIFWENQSIVLSVCTYCTLLHGNKNNLEEIIKRIKVIPFEERIQPLISLLFETYRNIIYYNTTSEGVKKVLLKEGIKKIEYILKFLLWEHLREKTKTIPPPQILTVLQLAKDNNINKQLIELLEKIEKIREKNITISDLKLLYESCLFEINKLLLGT